MAKLIFKPEKKDINIDDLMQENKELCAEYEKILALDDELFLSDEVTKRLNYIRNRLLEITKLLLHN